MSASEPDDAPLLLLRPDGPPPPASTEEIDQAVTGASQALASWLAVTPGERVASVVRFADVLRDLVERYRNRLWELSGAIGGDAEEFLVDSTDELRRFVAHPVELSPSGYRPGVCGIIHTRQRRPGKFLPRAIAGVLLSDSVVVVRLNPDTGALSEFAIRAGQGAGFPPGVISTLYGDDEAADALTSNPLISTVLVDGPPAAVAHTEALGRRFGKVVIDYPDSPAFR